MSLIRNMTRQAAFLRPLTRQTPQVAYANRRWATQDYGGSGEAGEDPKAQGKNPSEHLEHPGPAAPSTGKGGSSTQSQQGGESKSPQQPKETDSSKGTQGAQPKILNESPPTADKESAEVKQHNREMDQRAERSHDKATNEDVEKQKVGKEFWSGTGGADKDP